MTDQKQQALISDGESRSIDSQAVLGILSRNLERNDQIIALRRLGFACQSLADFHNLTRQQVNNIVPKNEYATPHQQVEKLSPQNIMTQLWQDAAQDPTLWGDSGRMSQNKIVKRFRAQSYTWRESRDYAREAGISKFLVVMIIKYGFDPNSRKDREEWLKDVGEWLQDLAETHTKKDIKAMINEAANPLQINDRAFDRAWSDLGVKAKRRQRTPKNS